MRQQRISQGCGRSGALADQYQHGQNNSDYENETPASPALAVVCQIATAARGPFEGHKILKIVCRTPVKIVLRMLLLNFFA